MSTSSKSIFLRYRLHKLLAHFLAVLFCYIALDTDFLRASSNSIDGQLLGVTWGAGPYKIDFDTGNAVQLDNIIAGHFNSMARSSSNIFLASDNLNRLFSINPLSGSMSIEVQATGFGASESIRGMAFTSDHRLYAVVSTPFGDEIDRLFEIDLSNGNAALIGATGMTGLQSLAIADDGTIYSFDIEGSGQGLVTIDPNTGIATDINLSDDDQGSNMQSLALSSDGTLYGVGNLNAIYEVDTFNGVLTELAPISLDFRGIEFLPIPEPTTLTLATLALCLITTRRRRWSAL